MQHWLEPHLAALRTYVRAKSGSLLRAKEAWTDLVQTVCCELLVAGERALPSEPHARRRYILQAAEHLLIDRVRYHTAECRHASDGMASLGGSVDWQTPERLACVRECLQRAMFALATLEDSDRVLIERTRLQGESQQAIAIGLGCSQGALRVRLHRATQRLERSLGRTAAAI